MYACVKTKTVFVLCFSRVVASITFLSRDVLLVLSVML